VQGHRCTIHSATVGEILVFAEFDEGCIDAVFAVVRVDLWIGNSFILCSLGFPVSYSNSNAGKTSQMAPCVPPEAYLSTRFVAR
jgi:hypothetical protein